MRTPKEFTKNLKNKTITMDMLELALYSINKRAKNCRDKKKEYYEKGKMSGYRNDYSFKTVEKYKKKEQEYYRQKDLLLDQLLDPVCIHKEVFEREEKVRYYDYEEEYEKHKKEAIYSNSYYDRDLNEFVEFIDILENEKIINYYLYYETPNYSFHIPIEPIQLNSYINKYNLQIKTIDNLKTYGKEITELLSVQFCKKIIDLVKSNDFKFIVNEQYIKNST